MRLSPGHLPGGQLARQTAIGVFAAFSRWAASHGETQQAKENELT